MKNPPKHRVERRAGGRVRRRGGRGGREFWDARQSSQSWMKRFSRCIRSSTVSSSVRLMPAAPQAASLNRQYAMVCVSVRPSRRWAANSASGTSVWRRCCRARNSFTTPSSPGGAACSMAPSPTPSRCPLCLPTCLGFHPGSARRGKNRRSDRCHEGSFVAVYEQPATDAWP